METRKRYFEPSFNIDLMAIACSLLLASAAFAANPVPSVSGVIPQAVLPGSGSFTLTVYGANFVSGAVVNWNNSPRATKFVSNRKLHVQILDSDVSAPTAGLVTVTNPGPGGGNSSSGYKTVEVHVPTTTMVANQPKIYGWRNNPVSSAVTADFNHDGNLDLSEVSAGLRTFLGNGDGTFHFGSISPRKLSVGMGLAFGDFNGDGMLDLVLTSGRDLRVAFGEGTGKFHIGPFFGTLYNPQQIVTADFNGDGKLDLVVTDSAGGLRVLLGNGDGTFQPQVDYPIQSADITVADFNGDGIPDLVVENDKNGESFLSLFIGKGDGTFQPPQDITSFSSFPGGFGPNLFLSDFNGDGLSDLAFGVRGKIGILIGKGDGSFQPPVFYSSGYPATEPFAFTAGDFNSDGNTDLLTYGFSKTKAKLLVGKGDGTFQPASGVNHPRRFGPEMGFLVGDFNSDGLLDFVALDASGGMAVYTQK